MTLTLLDLLAIFGVYLAIVATQHALADYIAKMKSRALFKQIGNATIESGVAQLAINALAQRVTAPRKPTAPATPAEPIKAAAESVPGEKADPPGK